MLGKLFLICKQLVVQSSNLRLVAFFLTGDCFSNLYEFLLIVLCEISLLGKATLGHCKFLGKRLNDLILLLKFLLFLQQNCLQLLASLRRQMLQLGLLLVE